MKMNKKQLASLHQAISNRLPLPEPTIKSLIIEMGWESSNWVPENLGFSKSTPTIEQVSNIVNMKKMKENVGDIRHVYLTQNQEFAQLTLRAGQGLTGDIIQLHFNSAIDDGLVENINSKLKTLRHNCLLNPNHELRKYEHSTLDAILHTDYSTLFNFGDVAAARIEGKDMIIPGQMELLDELQSWRNNPDQINEYYFAILCQLSKSPQGSTVDILSKNPEPEYIDSINFVLPAFCTMFTVMHDIEKLEAKEEDKDFSLLVYEVKERIIHITTKLATAVPGPFNQLLKPNPFEDVDNILKKAKQKLTPTAYTAFVKDAVVYHVIHEQAIGKYGLETVQNILSQLLIDIEEKQNYIPEIKQSIEFQMANFTLAGEDRITKLRELEKRTVSPIEGALTNYILGSKFELDDEERYERLLKALQIYNETDPHRKGSVIVLLISGQQDANDEGGNPGRVLPPGANSNPLTHITKLANILHEGEYSQDIQKLLISEVEDYIAWRLASYRLRCMNCSKVHLTSIQDPLSIDSEESINALIEVLSKWSGKDSKIKETILGINELLAIMKSIIFGKLLVTPEKLVTPTMHNILSEFKDITQIPDLYDLDSTVGYRLLENAASFCAHISERIFNPYQRSLALARAHVIFHSRQHGKMRERDYDWDMIELMFKIFNKFNPDRKDVLRGLIDQPILLSDLGNRISNKICNYSDHENKDSFMEKLGAKKKQLSLKLIEIFGENDLIFDPPRDSFGNFPAGEIKVSFNKDSTDNIIPESDIENKFCEEVIKEFKTLIKRNRFTKNQAIQIIRIWSLLSGAREYVEQNNPSKKLIAVLEAILGLNEPQNYAKNRRLVDKSDLPDDVVKILKEEISEYFKELEQPKKSLKESIETLMDEINKL